MVVRIEYYLSRFVSPQGLTQFRSNCVHTSHIFMCVFVALECQIGRSLVDKFFWGGLKRVHEAYSLSTVLNKHADVAMEYRTKPFHNVLVVAHGRDIEDWH